MRVFDYPQKSSLWWRARRGVPTASCFDKIITPKQGKPSASQIPYIDELLKELVDQAYSAMPDDSYVSQDMQNGIDQEHSARTWYSFYKDIDVQQVGFCLSDCGRYGCSPDGLVGDDGVLEIKCPKLETHIKYMRKQALPNEYKCQVHGELIVTGRKWVDFVSYSPSEEIDSLVIRVVPDGFTALLKNELDKFLLRYAAAQLKIGRSITRPVDETESLYIPGEFGND